MKSVKFDDTACSVTGLSCQREIVNFPLTYRHIKHIRRCLGFYDLVHPKAFEDDEETTKVLHTLFRQFGRIKHEGHTPSMRNKMKGKLMKCAWDGCTANRNLTIDHINPLSFSADNSKDNLRWLCPKHHALHHAEGVLRRKEQEVIKLKEKIELIHLGKDPQILGYQPNKLSMEEEI